ncbi:hypothetical protein X777_15671 [Ooceraea biroi]|uniref:Uncharacterized protein n=1 Tax=Ooceraea biroi TaxID=2015173 RepID=A0A026VVK4_OOCBI|nr:hypothetical protein X777_15671 [Ooceraea biroi]
MIFPINIRLVEIEETIVETTVHNTNEIDEFPHVSNVGSKVHSDVIEPLLKYYC